LFKKMTGQLTRRIYAFWSNAINSQKITPWEAVEHLSEGLYWYEWCLKIAVERRIK
jgi:hypothetical protein